MNKGIGLLFAAFVAAAVAYAFSARSGPPLPASEARIENALMLDARRAGNRIVAVGERGDIYVTEDEGGVWRRVPSGVGVTLTALAFADDRVGLAAGHDAVLLRTEDGGASWKTVFSAPEQLRPLLDVLFVSPEHAIAVGAYAAYFESFDAGRTWRERAISEGDRHFNAIARLADGGLLIAGEGGTLLRSGDAGATWKPLASPYAGSFFGILPLPAGGALIHGMRGALLRGDGDTWEKLESGGAESLFGGFTGPDATLTVLGQNGVILRSRDGGARFQRFLAKNRPTLAAGVALAKPGEILTFGDAGAQRQTLPTRTPP